MRRLTCHLLIAAGCGGGDGSNPDGNTHDGTTGPPPPPSFVQPPASFATSYGATGGVAIADVNADGLSDVIAFDPTAGSGIVTSFLSDSQGHFPTIQNGAPSATTATAIAAGSTSDTTVGAMTADATAGVSMYAPTATGVVDHSATLSLTPAPTAGQTAAMITLAGGTSAWLVEGTDTGLVVSAPTGTGYTTPGTPYLAGVSIHGVAPGYFGRTPMPDLAVVGSDAGNHAYVLPNAGNGTLGSPQTIDLPALPVGVAAGDIGAGKSGIVVATADQILLYRDRGGGTFPTAPDEMYAATGAIAVALGDFNADSKLDIATLGGADQVAIYTGNGDGTFNPPVTFAAGTQVRGFGLADFNADGKSDLVVAGAAGIYLLLNSTP